MLIKKTTGSFQLESCSTPRADKGSSEEERKPSVHKSGLELAEEWALSHGYTRHNWTESDAYQEWLHRW